MKCDIIRRESDLKVEVKVELKAQLTPSTKGSSREVGGITTDADENGMC